MGNVEILVADDGSADDGAAVADRFAASDQRVRVIRMGCNGGKSRAMNRMAEEARGEWFAVLDADDAYRPRRLERLIAAAETAGVEMAADNISYIDAGAGCAVRTAFVDSAPDRVVTKSDLAKNSSSHATFDFGILKPVIQTGFLRAQGLRYHEEARLSEDFYYLMEFFVAGGRGCIVSEALYDWTMPFGAISRRWTQTGSGAWRYDYRNALVSNTHFLRDMTQRGETGMVRMLRARERQYASMVHYIDAQRAAAEGRPIDALRGIALHPSAWGLLARRVVGRGASLLRARRGSPQGVLP